MDINDIVIDNFYSAKNSEGDIISGKALIVDILKKRVFIEKTWFKLSSIQKYEEDFLETIIDLEIEYALLEHDMNKILDSQVLTDADKDMLTSLVYMRDSLKEAISIVKNDKKGDPWHND